MDECEQAIDPNDELMKNELAVAVSPSIPA